VEVFLPAFLWGFGTALGELPPYFVARAASKAGNSTEELESILNKPENERTCMENLKVHLTSWLKSRAFITVLIAASIPNPLFDLAGVTCGHF
jgi:vacuole membrane protein 1